MSRVLYLSDLHIPFEHKKALDFAKKLADKYKVDKIISVGDIADFHAYSIKWSPDPNGLSPGDEYEMLRESIEPWYKSFPDLEIVPSNHDSRPYKKIFHASLPRQLFKGIGEFLGSPKGWIWNETGIDVDGCYVFHGEGLSQGNWHKAHEKVKSSVIHGHLHNSAGVVHHRDRKRNYVVMNTGCMIDEEAYCFRYSGYNFNKACLGYGIAIDGEFLVWERLPSKWK